MGDELLAVAGARVVVTLAVLVIVDIEASFQAVIVVYLQLYHHNYSVR